MRAKFILLILCASSIVAHAATTNSPADSPKAAALKSANEIFDFSTAKLAGYKTWSADITQTMNMFGREMVSKGAIIEKQPRKMHMQMDMPMFGQQTKLNTVLGDDGILWQVVDMAGRKQVMKMDVIKTMSNVLAQTGLKIDPVKAMDPSQQWAANREMINYTTKGMQTLDGQSTYVIEGNWKEAALTNSQMAALASHLGKAVVYIGQDDGFVHRYEQYPKTGSNIVMLMELSNVKFNQDASDDLFKYQPPAGVQVIDISQMAGSPGGNPPHAPATQPPAPASASTPPTPPPTSK